MRGTPSAYGRAMATMNAIVLREHGGPEVLQPEQLPTARAGPGEVRVRIRAVALNHLDLWVRRGGPAFKLEYPHRLGSDIVGDDRRGRRRRRARRSATKVVVQPGLSCGRCAQCLGGHDNLCRYYKILGENTQGGYAEYIVVPDANLAPYPERLDVPAGGRVDPAVHDRVADGRAQGARRSPATSCSCTAPARASASRRSRSRSCTARA